MATPFLSAHTGTEIDDAVDKSRVTYPLWSLMSLTGGGANTLDGVDVTEIQTGTTVAVTIAGTVSFYQLQETTDVESAPDLIVPDAPPSGDRRGWVKVNTPASVATVSSVGLTVPAGFSVSGTPVTSAGTLAITELTQAANKVKAGPVSGGGATPTYRSLVLADLPAGIVGGAVYQGTWNATTNSPALASGVGTAGFWYKVSVAGTTTIDGVSEWNVGDMIIFDGTVWDKIDNTAEDATTVLKGIVKLTQDLGGTSALPVVLQASTTFALTGVISPTSLSANVNDYAPTGLSAATVLRLTSGATWSITGLTGGAAGRIVRFTNVGSFNITLPAESASSAAANRFVFATNVTSYTLRPGHTLALQYDGTSSRWRPWSLGGAIEDNGTAAAIGAVPGFGFAWQVSGKQLNTFASDASSYGYDMLANASVASALLVRMGIAGVANIFTITQDASSLIVTSIQGGGLNVGAGTAIPAGEVSCTSRVTARDFRCLTVFKTSSATPIWDMDAGGVEKMYVTAAITAMTTSNRDDGKVKTIFLLSDGALHTLVVNASWIPIGPVIDASLAAGKTAILALHCMGGTGEGNIYYSYKAQP